MPSGLLIDLNDGGPRMEITAGLRCSSFCNYFPGVWDKNTYQISGYVPGSQIVVIPHNSVEWQHRDNNVIPTISMLESYSVSGDTITYNTWWSDKWGRKRTFANTVCQILPAQTGQGLLIQDSTDFLSITDSTMVGYCIWRGTVTVNGSWQTPTTNIDRNRYMVFAKWSADGVTVEFDGDRIWACQDRNGEDREASVTMQIAIFASGISPTPGPGLNFFKNGQCVFSTTKRPFVFRNVMYNPSWDWTDIGDRMILLGRYGFDSAVSGGWDYLKWAGLIRNGNSVRCGRGRQRAVWTANYSVIKRRLTSISIPCVDAMY